MPDSGESRFWWLRPVHTKVPQKDANRRAGQALASLLDEAARNEIEPLAARGERIRAIRRLREITGLPLNDARRIYESLCADQDSGQPA